MTGYTLIKLNQVVPPYTAMIIPTQSLGAIKARTELLIDEIFPELVPKRNPHWLPINHDQFISIVRDTVGWESVWDAWVRSDNLELDIISKEDTLSYDKQIFRRMIETSVEDKTLTLVCIIKDEEGNVKSTIKTKPVGIQV